MPSMGEIEISFTPAFPVKLNQTFPYGIRSPSCCVPVIGIEVGHVDCPEILCGSIKANQQTNIVVKHLALLLFNSFVFNLHVFFVF